MANRRTMGAVILDESMVAPNISSPLRRRSIAATPLPMPRKELIQNDDESEMLARRRQPPVIDSPQPADTSSRRVSLGFVAGLSSNEISEHYTKCLKLCAENKINAKNAFSLSMIDYMAVFNKRSTNLNNMQTAGTTLDVSTKIYGVRVDCVYSDVIKMAGDPGKEDPNNKEPIEGEGVADSSRIEDAEAKKKRKRRSQKILSSHESLSAKPSLLILRPTASHSDAQTTDLMLQAIFPVHTTSRHGLHLYEDVLLDTPPQTGDKIKERIDVEVPALEDFEDLNICPMFADFQFLGWSEADIPESPSPENSPSRDGFRFDLDASIVEPCGNDITGVNYFDSNSRSPENIERCGRMGNDSGEQIVDFCESVAVRDQQKNLEYSYLQKSSNNLHWAGPVHWKPRSLTKSLTESKVVGACRQQSARKKKEIKLDFLGDTMEIIHAGMKTKKQRKLQLRTVRQVWQEDKLTLPEDIHYDNENPTKFYYQSSRRLRLKSDNKPDGENEGDANIMISENDADYNYNNLNDTQDFCSQNGVAEEGFDDNNDDNLPNYDLDQDENQNPERTSASHGFVGENLVAAPKSTTQLQIQYASRAKKIDMRQLKLGLWKCLAVENRDPKNDEENKMTDEKHFSEVYKKLPNVLKKENTDALSIALAFSSLLHLANEKNLRIKPTLDMSDLKITQ